MIKTAGTKPNQDIIMTKWAGLEGTSIIANEREEELLERFAKDFVERAKGLINYISVIEEAKLHLTWVSHLCMILLRVESMVPYGR